MKKIIAVQKHFLFISLLGGLLCLQACESISINYKDQKLTEFPIEVCDSTQVNELYFGSKGFTVSPLLGGISPIESLNHFDSIPSCIGNLKHLEKLQLMNVGLKTLPKELFELPKLQALDVSFNTELNIQRYWDDFSKLKSLDTLGVVGLAVDENMVLELRKKNKNLTIITTQFLQEHFQ